MANFGEESHDNKGLSKPEFLSAIFCVAIGHDGERPCSWIALTLSPTPYTVTYRLKHLERQWIWFWSLWQGNVSTNPKIVWHDSCKLWPRRLSKLVPKTLPIVVDHSSGRFKTPRKVIIFWQMGHNSESFCRTREIHPKFGVESRHRSLTSLKDFLPNKTQPMPTVNFHRKQSN